MPWPASISQHAGSVAIDTTFSISASGAGASDPRVQEALERSAARLARQTGIAIRPRFVSADQQATLRVIVEQHDHRAPQHLGDDERYSLDVSAGHIVLSADAPLGALRGLETLLQLVQQNTTGVPGFSVPGVTIQDEPRFEWRGLSLDVSRHFIPVDEVERTIDGLAAVKLNVLHWHLSDDQGFRVESRKYSRLTQYGSDGLFYTQSQVRDVIRYARLRGIRVVPEFDLPGHATSWLPGYPKLGADAGPYEIGRTYGILSHLMDPTKESTYRFLDGFVAEMATLFPDDYFHIGGDEVAPKEWNENPRIQAFLRKHHLADAKALQAYFNGRMLKILTKHGKRMLGWDEILHPDLPKTIVIEAWRNDKPLAEAARQGYQSILASGYYLDLMYPAARHYGVDPLAGAAKDLTAEESKLILGGEAAMWEELATAENLDSRLWPRLAVIAERFWSPKSIADPASMYWRLEIVNRWLEWLGLTQRSNLELMRQRLAGSMPYEPLDRLASILEPVKVYGRHAERYTSSTPLNRLVDAIAPESDAARAFRDRVEQYVETPANAERSSALGEQLALWRKTAVTLRPMFAANSLLAEDAPILDQTIALCDAGQQAINHLESGEPAALDWIESNLSAVQEASEARGGMLVAISPGIKEMVESVPRL